MKYLLILLTLASCASTPPGCKFITEEEVLNVTYREYSCPDNRTKYCRKETSTGRSLGCFETSNDKR